MSTNEELRRCTLAVLIPVTINATPAAPWTDGPFPNVWRRYREGKPNVLIGTAAQRVTYINPRLERVLYRREDEIIRWHRSGPGLPSFDPARFTVTAFELLRLSHAHKGDGILVVHGAVTTPDPEDTIDTLKSILNHNPIHGRNVRGWLDGFMQPIAKVDPHSRRATFIAFVTSKHNSLKRLYDSPSFSEWSAPDDWLWTLSSQARYAPDPSALDDLRGRQLRPSSEIRAAVSRDALAIVGLERDPGPTDQSTIYNGIQFFVEGLHSDAMLLALGQRIVITRLADDIQEAGRTKATIEKLGELEEQVLAFRREYWTSDFAPQGIQNEFIQRYWKEHGLQAMLDQVSVDLSDYSRRVQTLATDTTNAVLGFLTLVGLPLTIGLTAWQGYNDARLVSLLIVVGVSLAVAALALTHPATRQLTRSMMRSIRPNRRR